MAISVDTGITLISKMGNFFGILCQVSDRKMLVEADTGYKMGVPIDFELELTDFGTTIKGKAEVAKITTSDSAPTRYLLEIRQFEGRGRGIYNDWLYELAQGMSSVSSRRRGGVGRSAVREALQARLAGIQPRSAKREVDAAKSRSATSSDSRSIPPTSRPPARERYGRTQRSATPSRSRSVRSQAAEAEFRSSPPSTPRAPRSPSPTTGRRSAEAEAQFRGSQRKRPQGSQAQGGPAPVEVKLAIHANPPLVVLQYASTESYSNDYDEYLSKEALFVPWVGYKPRRETEILVRIFLPGGIWIVCKGRVEAELPTGFGLSLELDDEIRGRLSAAARG